MYFHNILRFTHNSAFLSFKPNEIVKQTMCDKYMNEKDDSDIKGFYTTTIPLESLEEYDFNCNISEVNVIVTKLLMRSTSKIARGCKSINVVSNGFLLVNDEILESLVEVSSDLSEKSTRGRSKVTYEVDDEDCCKYELEKLEDELSMPKHSMSDEIFGRVVKVPYLHYLFTSRIDYKIHYLNTNLCYKSIVVRNPTLFKSQYGFDSRIFIAENGTILFCGCHRYSEGDTIIQPYNDIVGNYDADKED